MGESNSRSAEMRMLILYTLNEAEYPLTFNDLSYILLDSLIMKYSDFSEAQNFLEEKKYILKSGTEDFIDITPSGTEMLGIFEENIGIDKKKLIREYLKEKGRYIAERNAVSSHTEEVENGNCILTLKGREGKNPQISIKLNLPDRSMAEKMAKKWKKDYAKVYESLLNSLSS